MVKFIDLPKDEPYLVFNELYTKALKANQSSIEAISVSSYNKNFEEVSSRFVNLKYVIKDEWIFFTNYNSPKVNSLELHPQASVLFYWNKINTQIRIKAKVFRTSKEISDKHYAERSEEKNAIAVSSDQSKTVESFEDVKIKYLSALKNKSSLSKRPEHWGGISFEPYSFEFWEGNKFRLNKRTVYEKNGEKWNNFILQP